jgi:WD40 repeat protein
MKTLKRSWNLLVAGSLLWLLLVGSAAVLDANPDPSTITPLPKMPLLIPDGSATALAFSPDKSTLAIASQNRICLWQLSTGKKLIELKSDSARGEPCRHLTFSPNGRKLAAVHEGQETDGPRVLIRVWDLLDDDKPREAAVLVAVGQEGWRRPTVVYQAAFSPDGKALVSGRPDGRINIWDMATCRLRAQFTGGVAASFSSDGQTLIAVGHNGMIQRLDANTGSKIEPGKKSDGKSYHYVDLVAFAPNGTRVAICDPFTAYIMDPLTSETIQQHIVQRSVSCVVFSPDSRLLAIGDYSSGVVIADGITGRQLRRFDNQKRYQSLFDFSRDGRCVAWGEHESVVVSTLDQILPKKGAPQDAPPENDPPAGPLQARLTANESTYVLNLYDKTAGEVSQTLGVGGPVAVPKVDLTLQVRNVSDKPVLIRDEGAVTVHLVGAGAFNVPKGSRSTTPFTNLAPGKSRKLAPGEGYSIGIHNLDSYGLESYWLLPGEYTVYAIYCAEVSSVEGASGSGEAKSRYAVLLAPPIKVKVIPPRN